jgi:tetratricopeptide (TPR) repeat protein
VTDLIGRLRTALGTAYRIERELVGGGMSRVFVAEETALGRKVVVKMLPPELAAGLNVDRFRREIQLAASLQHPHIVPLLAAGAADDLLYYTMPLVEGESLRTRLARHGELPVGEAVRILRDVADALACAHERGVVHRDIKPDNILLSRHHGLVTDFGVAKALSESTGPSSITSTGLALGTPAYMAPEQATADPHLDHRVDIYALGVMGYEMLAGHPPFTGSSPQSVLAAQVTQVPDALAKARPSVPPALAALIMRCLEKRPSDRWQTVEEVLHQLEAMATPSGGSAPTTAVPAASRPTEPAAQSHPLLALAVFLVASAAVLAVTRVLVLRLGLPDWVLWGAIGLLAIGLPIILATAVLHSRGAGHRWFNWPKAISGGVAAFAGLGLLTAAYTAMRVLGIGPIGSLLASGVLQQRDQVIVADFENRAGDRLLGEALTNALLVDLSQSPVVTLVQPEAVRDVLRRMARPDTSRLDLGLAREVAIREGIKAVVVGNISPAGRQLVVSARLISADSGTTLAAFRETAEDSTAILHAVDRVSKRLRERIGESLRSIRSNPPLEQVTTASLGALRKYTQGNRVADAGDPLRGVALLEEAVALDPGFAMAYRRIGVVLGNWRERRDRQIEALGKAFEYRKRLTDRERYLAEGSYYSTVTGERQKARDAYQTLLDLYPDEPIALNNLAEEYQWLRDYAAAERLYRRALAADSSSPIYYTNLSEVQVAQGRSDLASRTLELAESRFPHGPMLAAYRGWLAMSNERYDSVAEALRPLIELSQPDPSFVADGNWQLANAAGVRGRLAEADRRLQQAMAILERREVASPLLGMAAYRSQVSVWYRGPSPNATRELERVLRAHPLDSISATDRPYLDLALAYAMADQPARATALLDEYERVVPASFRRNDEPFLLYNRGMIALGLGRHEEAISLLQKSDQGSCRVCAWPLLGRAYDAAGLPDSAIALYERYLATPWMFRSFVDVFWRPFVYQRLGELHEGREDRERAADYYGRFIALWKDADPELRPRVAEARRRLAALTSEPRQ